MRLMQDPEMEDKKNTINNVLSLIFPNQKITLLPPRSMIF